MKRKSPLFIALFGLFAAMIATPAFGAWTTSISKVEKDGNHTAYAYSDNTTATKQMKAPYADLEAWLGVGCVGFQEWVFVGFSEAPKLDNTTTEFGHDLVRTKIKWDGKAEDVELTQDPGTTFLHFHDDKAVISRIAESYTVVLDLDWHGEGKRSFEFSLKGSSAALARIRRLCGGK